MNTSPSSPQSPQPSPSQGKLRHSRTSKVLVIICGVALFLFFAVSLFLGKTIEFTEKVTISSPPERILPYINDLKRWRGWSVWNEEYYLRQGNSPIYKTNNLGETIRSMERQTDAENNVQIIEIERQEISPEKAVFSYSFWDGEKTGEPLIRSITTFSLLPQGKNTTVAWNYRGDYSPVMGLNPLQKYFLFFTRVSLSRAYRESLAGLKKKLEE